jgi:hypothetical protein
MDAGCVPARWSPRVAFLAAVWLVAASLPASADAMDEESVPKRVQIAVYVIDLDAVGTVEQNFTANVVVRLRWHDPSEAHGGPGAIEKPLSDIWCPRLQILNQQRIHPSLPETARIEPDGQVRYVQRYWGDFSQPLALRNFPFDEQDFHLRMVLAGVRRDEVELVSDADMVGIAEQLSVPDWRVTGWSAGPETWEPVPGTRLPGFTFRFEAARKRDYYIIKVIVPLVLIVVMSWVVFFTRPGESGTDIGVAMTAMLTLIAYRFAIGGFLPVISYLTRLDYFILGATVLVFSSMAQVVIVAYLVRSNRREWAVNVDRVARILFPAAFVYITVHSLFLSFGE